eukprot:1392101-Amorphochlora_amoeboformis.AAC.1
MVVLQRPVLGVRIRFLIMSSCKHRLRHSMGLLCWERPQQNSCANEYVLVQGPWTSAAELGLGSDYSAYVLVRGPLTSTYCGAMVLFELGLGLGLGFVRHFVRVRVMVRVRVRLGSGRRLLGLGLEFQLWVRVGVRAMG